MKKKWSLNQSTSGVKKEWPRAKKALLNKMWNRNGWPRPSAFDRIKNFDHHDLTAKHLYFRCSRSSNVAIFDKMTTLQNIRMKEQCFAAWSSSAKILIPWPSTSGDLEPEIKMFCSEVMMIKFLILSGPGCPF